MKQEINVIVLLIAFPLLFIGGNTGNAIMASIGVILIVLNAGAITIKRKPFNKQQAGKEEPEKEKTV